jgi:hypothetical protein
MRGIVVDWVLTQSNLFLRAFAGNTSRAALAKNNAVMVDYNHPGRRISTKSRDVGKKTWRCILGPDEEPDYVPILIAVAAVAAVVIAAILTDGAVLVPLIP